MRHGPAEDDAPSGRDFDRKLTVRGRERTERVARALARRAEPPRRIVCSPLARTVETAEVVSAVLGFQGEIELRDELAPGADVMATWRARDSWALGDSPVLLIGHEPDLTIFTTRLCSSWSGRYDKAMVVGLEVEHPSDSSLVPSGYIAFTIHPKSPDN